MWMKSPPPPPSPYGYFQKSGDFTSQIIHLFIGFSMIFAIHFGGQIPLCLVQHPYLCIKFNTSQTDQAPPTHHNLDHSKFLPPAIQGPMTTTSKGFRGFQNRIRYMISSHKYDNHSMSVSVVFSTCIIYMCFIRILLKIWCFQLTIASWWLNQPI